MVQQKEYQRFNLAQRIEHWGIVISFTLLVVTGIPQKFADWGISDTIIGWFGGIEMTRVIHHIAAAIIVIMSAYHIIVIAYKIFVLRVRWTMFPRLQDALDALDIVRYNLGLTKERPRLPRYSFEEKAEYWAMVWGTVVMALTGFIMWNPINAAKLIPGDLIPAAKAAHGAEAVLAALAIIVWHFYNVHLKTFNKTVFTGNLTHHQMDEDHGGELDELEQGLADKRPAPDVIKQRERAFIPIALVVALVMFGGIIWLLTGEQTAITTLPRRAAIQIYSPITPTPTVRATTVPGNNVIAKPLPADHAGRTICLGCHATLPQPVLPADHKGRTDATCSACHKVGGAAPVSGTPTASSTSAASGTPKAQPADHAGRTACNACHQTGVSGPKSPDDHVGRVDGTCNACHKPSN